MKEVFKKIFPYFDYEISNFGNVKCCKKVYKKNKSYYVAPEYIVHPYINGEYLAVCIHGQEYFIHKLVAENFIPNSQDKKHVVHISENKFNNNVDNLMWASKSDIAKMSIKQGKSKAPRYLGKMVRCIETGKTYSSIKETMRETNLSYNSIINSIYSKKQIKGYTFEFC